MSTLKLENQVAIITGAANGCGRAAVKLFLKEGARVVGADQDSVAGSTLAAQLDDPNFTFVHADVSLAKDVRRVTDVAREQYGSIDILHHQAGAILVKPLLETTERDYDFAMNNNVRSIFLMAQAVLPQMLRQGRGVLVTTSSVSGSTATPMETIYCSSKAAVSQFTRAVAVEFRDKGIRANTICPGFVRTNHGESEMAQLRRLGIDASEKDISVLQGRMCEPEEVARVALFLASEDSSFINGAEIAVDNTFTAI